MSNAFKLHPSHDMCHDHKKGRYSYVVEMLTSGHNVGRKLSKINVPIIEYIWKNANHTHF